MEKYFDQGDLTIEEVRRGLKLGLASRSVFPVLCCSAKENMGVGRMLEFISNNVPSPNEAVAIKTLTNGEKVSYDSAKPTTLFVFKTSNEQHLGEIAFMKVMAGEIVEGMDVLNSKNQNKERISQVYANSGKTRTKLDKAVAGDIISTIKLKDAKTNTTLNSAKNASDTVSPIEFPLPIYTTAVKAHENTDDEKVGALINEFCQHDRSMRVELSRELKQTIIKGMGELHINTLKWYFDNQHKIAIEFLAPKIPYRETITKSAEASYRHKKQ